MVIRSRIRIPDHFSASLSIAEYGFLGDLLAFLLQSFATFQKLGEMTDADERINSLHFGSDPADPQVSLEIWIWILDQILTLSEFVAIWVLLFINNLCH